MASRDSQTERLLDQIDNQGEQSVQDEGRDYNYINKISRFQYMRKVYSILMCQLIIILVIVSWCRYHKPTQNWVRTQLIPLWISCGGVLALIICTSCSNVRLRTPWNLIFAFSFTLLESYALARISAQYETEIIILAVGITAAICLGIIIFSFQTKYACTGWECFGFIALFSLFFILIVTLLFYNLQFFYGSLGGFFISIFFMHDAKRMMSVNYQSSVFYILFNEMGVELLPNWKSYYERS